MIGLLFGALLVPASGAPARSPGLAWRDCADGFQCATAKVPRDYAKPTGRQIELSLIRLPAQDRSRRTGSLFFNFGGPGAPGVETLRAIGREYFGALNDRFDFVGWDPRGIGTSEGAVDCRVNQETDGIYGQPFARPTRASEAALAGRVSSYVFRCLSLNAGAGLLPYIHTANTVRDLDRLRAAVGDSKLSYLGYSYGTKIGATYATFFPRRVRAVALDGAVDVKGLANRPLQVTLEQTQGFERALDRFFAACAVQQDVCRFGGTDPEAAYDKLLERLDGQPIPAPSARNPAAVDGDDARAAAAFAMYAKQLWPILAAALAQAQAGDGSTLRELTDAFYFRREDGSYDPLSDQFVAIQSLDSRYPNRVRPYLRTGRRSYRLFHHVWWNSGYGDLGFGLWPVEPRGAYFGPVRNSRRSPTALVVGTTYDPATPFASARRLTAELGNARLLTMQGDGHTAAFAGNSACIDAAVEAYLEQLKLPPRGTVCEQQVPFAAPRLAAAGGARQALRAVRARGGSR